MSGDKKKKAEDEALPEPKIATDEDFDDFINACNGEEGWRVCFDEDGIKVWDQKVANSDINIVKVRTVFKDVPALTLYDVFHDADYRREWDENMIDGHEFESLDANNDVGYYSVKCPAPLTNRDFVNQRSWRVKGDTYVIYNHSVNYPKCPEKKGLIRARSIRTGYYVLALPDGGCQLNYLTQGDPKGSIPSLVSNFVTKKLAPKIVQKIEKASKGYTEWKAKHNPENHPWR
jgi:hypothetical protein